MGRADIPLPNSDRIFWSLLPSLPLLYFQAQSTFPYQAYNRTYTHYSLLSLSHRDSRSESAASAAFQRSGQNTLWIRTEPLLSTDGLSHFFWYVFPPDHCRFRDYSLNEDHGDILFYLPTQVYIHRSFLPVHNNHMSSNPHFGVFSDRIRYWMLSERQVPLMW